MSRMPCVPVSQPATCHDMQVCTLQVRYVCLPREMCSHHASNMQLRSAAQHCAPPLGSEHTNYECCAGCLYVCVPLQACVQCHHAQVGGRCGAVWRIHGPAGWLVQPGDVAPECAHQAGAVQITAGPGSGFLRLRANRCVVLHGS